MSSKPSLLQKKQPKFRLGQVGEQLATDFLIQQNYTIIDRNVRWKQLEVDIIAVDRASNELVFVEVKTRTTPQVSGHLAINHQKMTALSRFARQYTHAKKLGLAYRVDAICIMGTTIDHYRNLSWYQ